jgi:hypothetical protein
MLELAGPCCTTEAYLVGWTARVTFRRRRTRKEDNPGSVVERLSGAAARETMQENVESGRRDSSYMYCALHALQCSVGIGLDITRDR